MKKIIFSFISLLAASMCLISCGVTSSQVLEGKADGGENSVSAGQLPVLQICPPAPAVPGTSKNENESFDIFLDPESVEESDKNEIVIRTDVPEVEIYINNTYQGKSDLNIIDLVPGSYILDLKKEGYKSVNTFITVNRNRKYIYFITMENNE